MTHASSLQYYGFLCSRIDLETAGQEKVGAHNAAVKPVNGTSAPNAADHANIRAIDFGDNVADKKFRKSGSIRKSCSGLLEHSHSNVLPALGAKCAREIVEHTACCPSSKFDSAPHYYGLLFHRGTGFTTGARA